MIQHSRPWITPDDHAAIQEALDDEQLAHGGRVGHFEREVADHLGRERGVATSSGTSAIALALRAVGVGAGDEVVVPTYTCPEVTSAIASFGAVPVTCDIGEDWCIDVSAARAATGSSTRAIIAVHTFGVAADISGLKEIGPPVVEDLAQAFGGRVKGVPLGGVGDIVACSFHATKVLCTGEGGMVLGTADELAAATESSDGNRMSDLAAALGLSQLARLPAILERRRVIAEQYLHELAGVRCSLPDPPSTMWFRFPIRVSAPVPALIDAFAEHGVAVRRGVDNLLHQHIGGGPHPVAERLFASTLTLPIYPALSDEEVADVVAVARRVLG